MEPVHDPDDDSTVPASENRRKVDTVDLAVAVEIGGIALGLLETVRTEIDPGT